MCEAIKRFGQPEYNRVLDYHGARRRGLGQSECEELLVEHGASQGQAKNGAYVYLHHRGDSEGKVRGSREEYDRLLEKFGARKKSARECVRFLESHGFSYGQAKTAVYQYRYRNGLIR